MPIKSQEPEVVGLDARQWKHVKMIMLTTGTFDFNLFESLNTYQRYWVNETKKSYRDLTNN